MECDERRSFFNSVPEWEEMGRKEKRSDHLWFLWIRLSHGRIGVFLRRGRFFDRRWHRLRRSSHSLPSGQPLLDFESQAHRIEMPPSTKKKPSSFESEHISYRKDTECALENPYETFE
jgi:hypothetical protein